MKALVLIFIALVQGSISQAAVTRCGYVAQACDPAGDHFYCRVFGWTGPGTPEFCSGSDVGSPTQGAQLIDEQSLPEERPEACGACTGEPQPSRFCAQTCGCTSAFCGAW